MLSAASLFAEIPLINVPEIAKAPELSAVIDESFIQQAVKVETQVNIKTGKAPENKTVFYLGRTRDTLWIGAVCSLAGGGKIEAQACARDGAIYQDDAIEIFIAPDPQNIGDYFQFIANARGSIYDGRVYASAWNGDWEVKTQVRESDWVALVKIPFQTIGIGYSQGRLLRINLCRDAKAVGKPLECSAWLLPGHHQPVGYLTLGGVDGGYFIKTFENEIKQRGLAVETLSEKNRTWLKGARARLESFNRTLTPDEMPGALNAFKQASDELAPVATADAFDYIFPAGQ